MLIVCLLPFLLSTHSLYKTTTTTTALVSMAPGSVPRPTDVSYCWKRKEVAAAAAATAAMGEEDKNVRAAKIIVPGVPLEPHEGAEDDEDTPERAHACVSGVCMDLIFRPQLNLHPPPSTSKPKPMQRTTW